MHKSEAVRETEKVKKILILNHPNQTGRPDPFRNKKEISYRISLFPQIVCNLSVFSFQSIIRTLPVNGKKLWKGESWLHHCQYAWKSHCEKTFTRNARKNSNHPGECIIKIRKGYNEECERIEAIYCRLISNESHQLQQ